MQGDITVPDNTSSKCTPGSFVHGVEIPIVREQGVAVDGWISQKHKGPDIPDPGGRGVSGKTVYPIIGWGMVLLFR